MVPSPHVLNEQRARQKNRQLRRARRSSILQKTAKGPFEEPPKEGPALTGQPTRALSRMPNGCAASERRVTLSGCAFLCCAALHWDWGESPGRTFAGERGQQSEPRRARDERGRRCAANRLLPGPPFHRLSPRRTAKAKANRKR